MDEFEDIPSGESESDSSAANPSDEPASGSGSSASADTGAPDYSEIIDEIQALGAKLDSLDGKLASVSDDVSSLADAGGGSGDAGVDYSGQLDALGQNVALTNVFLIVLLVGVFLVAGLSFGNNLVKWFRHER